MKSWAWLALALAAAGPALAQEATDAAPAAAAAVPALNSGDTAWMLTSSLLVLFMILPGLALFYGGLVRSKNMLSVLMQCTVIASLVMVLYAFYGYSMSFGGGESKFWGGLGKAFLAGVTKDSVSGTIPELVFVAFQMTFACITPALIVGGFAERMRFSAVVLFTALWVTIVYFPIAHMAWDPHGLYFLWGAYDFAGGTVVHINAGIAALVGAMMIGPRIGHRKEIMAPHSMTLTMVGVVDPLGRLVRLQRRLGALGRRQRRARDDEHLHRDRRRGPRLVGDRGGLPRQGLDARRRLRHGRGPRRRHAGRRLHRAGRGDLPRLHRLGRLLLLRAGGEGALRLRRQPRRLRRARHRRHRRRAS